MSRCLLVGDPHAVPEELEDLEALMGLIWTTAVDFKVDHIIFLGDEHHTHSVMHIPVMTFWRKAFHRLAMKFHVVAIVGNHDQPGNDKGGHALLAYKDMDNVTVVDVPTEYGWLPGVMFAPYYHDGDKLVEDSKQFSSCSTLICHQTFMDCLFENGFPCKEGVDSNLITQKSIISGHIHKMQRLGKLWYVGAPRWRSLTDAAEKERHLQVLDFAHDGSYKEIAAVATGDTVKRVIYIEDAPGFDEVVKVHAKDELRVDIKGPSAYVNERHAYWKGQGARVRTFKLDQKQASVKESIGIDKAFQQFVGMFKSKYGTSPDRISKLAQERL